MVDGEVKFLDLVGFGRGGLDADVRELLQAVVAGSSEADDLHFAGLGGDGGVKDVAAVTGGADSQQNVAGAAVAVHLLGKTEQRLAVVHVGSTERDVAVQGDRGKGALQVAAEHATHLRVGGIKGLCIPFGQGFLYAEGLHHLAHYVLGIRRTAAIACGKQLSVVGIGIDHDFRRLENLLPAALERRITRYEVVKNLCHFATVSVS